MFHKPTQPTKNLFHKRSIQAGMTLLAQVREETPSMIWLQCDEHHFLSMG